MNSQTNFPYNRKRTIYVGGFGEEVDEKMLHAAFIPFGDIVDVSMPLDFETNKHRGFGFIEYEMDADAASAVDNMNKGELFGRTIHVNFARPPRPNERMLKPVWADDEWLKQYGSGAGGSKAIVEGTSGLHEVIESLTGVQEKCQSRKETIEDTTDLAEPVDS
uniref:RRM domain-containing protein n=1 Tax=Trichuris muris TaxID=70415 RepID=A0A5S6QFG7_TRIMR